MDQVDGGGAGPFAYYPASADAIRDTAADVSNRAVDIRTLRRQVEADHRRALAGVGGDLTDPVTGAADALMANADQVEQAAWFAAGVVRLFADAVDDYNHYSTRPRSVAALNLAYTEAVLDDFGIDDGANATGGSSAHGDDEADRADAEADLRHSLTAEYHRLGGWLDERADQAAGMLDRGPNQGDVTALWAAGALPPNAIEIWPGLHLAEVPLLRLPYELRNNPGDHRTLRQLSQGELRELWETYDFEPARQELAEEIVHDYEYQTGAKEYLREINLAYMFAMAHGLPEWAARKLATIHPETLFDLVKPFSAPAELAYALTVKDLIDAVCDDVWSLRTLGEVAMVLPYGRIGKIGKIDEAIDAMDDLRDAERLGELAESAIDGGRTLTGRFPHSAQEGGILVRRAPDGSVTNYQVYGSDGMPLKRVDVTGRSHAGVETPHVVEFDRHTNPRTGEVFVRPRKMVRPASPEELMGLD